MGYKNQLQRILEERSIGASFGYPRFIQGKGFTNLAGDILVASKDMTAEEYAKWAKANPESFGDTQANGVALVKELDTLFERFSVAHGEAVGLASAVQTLDPAETLMLGNYFMSIINGLGTSHNKLKEEYATALNRTPYTFIEDFQELIPRVKPVTLAMEAFRDQLRESAGDPEKAKELAKKTKSEGTIGQIGSIAKWVVVGGIAFIVLKTFLPDIRNMITKKSQA